MGSKGTARNFVLLLCAVPAGRKINEQSGNSREVGLFPVDHGNPGGQGSIAYRSDGNWCRKRQRNHGGRYDSDAQSCSGQIDCGAGVIVDADKIRGNTFGLESIS